jgi:molecular chaperone GrpE (heat shock protein)
MKEEKDFLKKKFIDFQSRIAGLSRALKKQEETSEARENDLYLNLFELLDAFENLEETIEAKKAGFDKTARSLAKNIQAIHKKLLRFIKDRSIERMEFPDHKARMEYCKVVDTREAPDLENETIISVVRNGYIDKGHNQALRKAEVITVLNGR